MVICRRDLEIEEHSLRFRVNLLHGQKTGHFLDQKENHLLLMERVKDKDVLDCFSYSGSWGIHAAFFGAARVICVDSSERAVALARENAAVNGFADIVECEAVDAFDRLQSLKGEGKRFDVVVLDPPAFVKNRKVLQEALKGYFTINRRAMELLRPGGYLITCSCSYHLEREMFRDLLANAAQKARREMRLIEVRSQAPDHPVLLAVPETEYLKCFVLQAFVKQVEVEVKVKKHHQISLFHSTFTSTFTCLSSLSVDHLVGGGNEAIHGIVSPVDFHHLQHYPPLREAAVTCRSGVTGAYPLERP